MNLWKGYVLQRKVTFTWKQLVIPISHEYPYERDIVYREEKNAFVISKSRVISFTCECPRIWKFTNRLENYFLKKTSNDHEMNDQLFFFSVCLQQPHVQRDSGLLDSSARFWLGLALLSAAHFLPLACRSGLHHLQLQPSHSLVPECLLAALNLSEGERDRPVQIPYSFLTILVHSHCIWILWYFHNTGFDFWLEHSILNCDWVH